MGMVSPNVKKKKIIESISVESSDLALEIGAKKHLESIIGENDEEQFRIGAGGGKFKNKKVQNLIFT